MKLLTRHKQSPSKPISYEDTNYLVEQRLSSIFHRLLLEASWDMFIFHITFFADMFQVTLNLSPQFSITSFTVVGGGAKCAELIFHMVGQLIIILLRKSFFVEKIRISF